VFEKRELHHPFIWLDLGDRMMQFWLHLAEYDLDVRATKQLATFIMMSAGQNRQSFVLLEFIGASSSCSALPLSQIVHDLAFIMLLTFTVLLVGNKIFFWFF